MDNSKGRNLQCPSCGRKLTMVRFDNQCFEVEHKGDHISVDNLSGWRCKECGEAIFDQESAERYGAAGDRLVISKR